LNYSEHSHNPLFSPGSDPPDPLFLGAQGATSRVGYTCTKWATRVQSKLHSLGLGARGLETSTVRVLTSDVVEYSSDYKQSGLQARTWEVGYKRLASYFLN